MFLKVLFALVYVSSVCVRAHTRAFPMTGSFPLHSAAPPGAFKAVDASEMALVWLTFSVRSGPGIGSPGHRGLRATLHQALSLKVFGICLFPGTPKSSTNTPGVPAVRLWGALRERGLCGGIGARGRDGKPSAPMSAPNGEVVSGAVVYNSFPNSPTLGELLNRHSPAGRYHPHFIDEQTEATRRWNQCLRSPNKRSAQLGVAPGVIRLHRVCMRCSEALFFFLNRSIDKNRSVYGSARSPSLRTSFTLLLPPRLSLPGQ